MKCSKCNYKSKQKKLLESKHHFGRTRKVHIKDSNSKIIKIVPKTVLGSVKDCKSRPELSTIVTQCISLMLEVIDSYYIIELAGYKLSPHNEVHRAYSELLQYYNCGDIKSCNEHLESLGIDKKHFLEETK